MSHGQADEINRMPIKKFREVGYLQELNRQFLHPLGLALEVIVEPDGTERFGGVWDYRDDPEGMNYSTVTADHEARARRVLELGQLRHQARLDGLGYWIQPAGIRDNDWAAGELVEEEPTAVETASLSLGPLGSEQC